MLGVRLTSTTCPTCPITHAETPAHQMLAIIRAILQGAPPPMAMVLAVQRALQQSQDVYRPPSKELQTRLNEADNMDVSRVLQ